METLERLRSVRGRVQHEQADAFIQEVSDLGGTGTQTGLTILTVVYINVSLFYSEAFFLTYLLKFSSHSNT